MAKVLMVIAPQRFRDEELFETRAELDRAGHEVMLASTVRGLCMGSRGGSALAQITLEEVDTAQLDALVFVGGGGSTLLFHNPVAHRLAQEMSRSGKVLAAICLAPTILAEAGVLAGKKATVSGGKAAILQQRGATYTGPGVMVDENIITANAPKASREFGRQINTALAGQKHSWEDTT